MSVSHLPIISKSELLKEQIRGIQFGCRRNFIPHCINLDKVPFEGGASVSQNENPIEIAPGTFFLQFDATLKLPFENESFEWVFAEHFIEHLSLFEAIHWLEEVKRLLKPRGVIRISTPDIEKYVRGYLDSNEDFFKKQRDILQEINPVVPNRRAWMLNHIFRCFEHQWLYDFDELVYIAKRAGFLDSNVTRQGFGIGSVQELSRWEQEKRRFESLYVEIVK